MPREAKLFASSAGSAVRGYLKFRANIPPRWIRNARKSRKRIEPEVDAAFRSFMRLRKNRPRARVAIRNAEKKLRAVLNRWETAYNKRRIFIGVFAFSWSYNGVAPRSCRHRPWESTLKALDFAHAGEPNKKASRKRLAGCFDIHSVVRRLCL